MGTLPAPMDVAMSWWVWTTEPTSGRASMMATCSMVSRGGTGRVDDAAALLAGVPLAAGPRGVGIEVDLDEVTGGDLVVGLQDGFDEHPVGAGNAGADVAVEVDEALVVEDARALGDLLLEPSDGR